MDFWAHINGKDYPICIGMSINENFGNELDGGEIVLAHIAESIDVKPYDDIYIHNYGEGNLPEHMFGHFFNGTNRKTDGSELYCNEVSVPVYLGIGCEITDNDLVWKSPIGDLDTIKIYKNANGNWQYDNEIINLSDWGIKETTPLIQPITNLRYIIVTKTNAISSCHFFWHFLAWDCQREQFHRDNGGGITPPDIYNYRISLISETKGLERVYLPNRCITQGMRTNENSLTKKASVFSVLEIAKELVELYSPYEKVTIDGKTWEYRRTYSIGKRFEEMFDSVVCPELTMNEPTLREAFDELCNTSDCIVVVHDGIIDYMNLSEVGKEKFAIYDENEFPKLIGNETWSMAGSEYCDRILKNYSNTLSQVAVVTTCENVGFRSYENDSLNLGNLSIELAYPIYEIERVVMKYYIKIGDYYYEYKSDITPFVVRSEKRNQLSTDWETFDYIKSGMVKEEFAKFKYATVGYSIGSKKISGWGDTYSFLNNYVFTNTREVRSVIENMVEYCAINYPEGFKNDYMYTDIAISSDAINFNDDKYNAYKDSNNFFTPTYEEVDYYGQGKTDFRKALGNIKDMNSQGKSFLQGLFDCIFDDDGTYTQFLKTIVFEVRYKALTSAAVVATKQIHDGNVVIKDNMVAAYGYFEKEGEKQKDKVNKFGNAAISFTQRVRNHSDEYSLSSVRIDKGHENEIVYKKVTTFLNDYCSVTYYLAKNFVVRNMYTSVYTKNRAYAYNSRENAITRKENKSVRVLLSDSEYYIQKESKNLSFQSIDGRNDLIGSILSFYKETEFDIDLNPVYKNNLDVSYYLIPESSEVGKHSNVFHVEQNAFCCGESLCFNVSMVDSMSAGTYIGRWAPNFKNTISAKYMVVDAKHNADLLTGSLQEYSTFDADEDTGRINVMHFGIGSKETKGTAYRTSPSDQIRINGIYPMYPCYLNGVAKSSYAYIIGSKLDTSHKYNGWYKFEPSIDRNYTTGETYYNVDSLVEKIGSVFGDGDNVYKDGNELINLTMQFEVIPSENIFLNNIIKYSDLFETYKNYGRDASITITFRKWIYVEMNTHNDARIQVSDGSSNYFTPYIVYPVLDITVDGPRDTSFSMNINKDFEWKSGNYKENELGNCVNITVNSIKYSPNNKGKIQANITVNKIQTTYYVGSLKASQCKTHVVLDKSLDIELWDLDYMQSKLANFIGTNDTYSSDMYIGLGDDNMIAMKTNMLKYNDMNWVPGYSSSDEYYNVSESSHLFSIASFAPHHDKYIGVYSLIIDKIAFNENLISGSVTTQGMTTDNMYSSLAMPSDKKFNDIMNKFLFDTTGTDMNYYLLWYYFTKTASSGYGNYRQSSLGVVSKRQTITPLSFSKNIVDTNNYNMVVYYSKKSLADIDRKKGAYNIDDGTMFKISYGDGMFSYKTIDGIPTLVIDFEDYAPNGVICEAGDSIRLYERFSGSDGKDKYNFIFGVNLTDADIKAHKKYVYVSVLDSLSKNVYYSGSGDKDYKITNVAKEDNKTNSVTKKER